MMGPGFAAHVGAAAVQRVAIVTLAIVGISGGMGVALLGYARFDERATTAETEKAMLQKRLDAVQKRLDAVQKRLDAVQKRLAEVEGLLDGCQQDLVDQGITANARLLDCQKATTENIRRHCGSLCAKCYVLVRDVEEDLTGILDKRWRVSAEVLP
jgi:predicted  nucleic acid-binding Zn-ribbon protein